MSRLATPPRALAVLAISLSAVLLAGCSSSGDDAEKSKSSSGSALPAAQDVLSQSAAAMKDVTSVGFALSVEGKPNLPVKAMNGDLLKSGDAQGDATVASPLGDIQAKFVLVGPDFYYYVLGKYTKAPRSTISSIVDPTKILDPEKGVPSLLTQAQGAKTVGREGGSVKIDATLPATAVSSLGVKATGDVKGSVWIADADHRLSKVRMEMPGGAVILGLSNYNANPTIKAPQ